MRKDEMMRIYTLGSSVTQDIPLVKIESLSGRFLSSGDCVEPAGDGSKKSSLRCLQYYDGALKLLSAT